MTSATDELRRMLDERGVEWWNETDPEPQNVTMARAGGQLIAYHENANGSIGYHVCNTHDLTPEQAIAATLGESPSLPHFWTHDGTLHVELPKLPESISVRLPDQRDREAGSARVWQYMLGAGTCHDVAGMEDVFECSACGGRYKAWALKCWARYCPDCGAKVVDDG